MPHLFEAFFTTKPAGKGLGLGLALSRLIIDSLGGSLAAANDPAGGARFEIRLPLA
jgi:two-component system C4-dicarboxylate transport sensor histidine kinase DctB